jgi:hypothetical protein
LSWVCLRGRAAGLPDHLAFPSIEIIFVVFGVPYVHIYVAWYLGY